MTQLLEVAGAPLLDAGGRTWSRADMFLAARLWGEWQPWAMSIRDPPAVADRRKAEEQFRRKRKLLSADELQDWLAARQLTISEWRAWLYGGDDSFGPHTTWTAGVCSGRFDAWTAALAERAAALADVDPVPSPSAPPDEWSARMPSARLAAKHGIAADELAPLCELLWQAERAHIRLRTRAIGGDALARTVAANNADWLRVDCELVQVGDEHVAREAALLVREDGMALPDAASAAGLALASDRMFVGELPADLQPRLLSAAPGELIGPVAVNGGWVLAHVREKVIASTDDPEVRARAERAAVRAALDRAVREHVTWHGE